MTINGALVLKDGKVISVPWGSADQPWVPCTEFGPDCHPTYQKVTAWGALPSYPLWMSKLTQGDHEISGGVVYANNAYAWLGMKWGYLGMYHWLESKVPIGVQLQVFQAAIMKVLA